MGVENPVIKGTKCICGYGMDTLVAENGNKTMWCSICNRVKSGDLIILRKKQPISLDKPYD
jgi:hypothetical protein